MSMSLENPRYSNAGPFARERAYTDRMERTFACSRVSINPHRCNTIVRSRGGSDTTVGLVALVLNFAMVGLITLPSQFGQRLRQSGRELADRCDDRVYCLLTP